MSKMGSRVPKRHRRRKPLLPVQRESWAFFSLLAIMLLGAALRFYALGFQSLSGDELAGWSFSAKDTVSRVVEDAVQPPLYFLSLHFTRWIFGASEWALRLPSAVAGWLSIPAIYYLGRRLYSEREGLIAALLVAVLWAPVYYSQEAGPLSVLILLSILTFYFWWDIMLGLRYRGELPRAEAACYVVCAVLCAYTHYFGLLFVVMQGVALAALARGTRRVAALLYLPVFLAYVPWLPSMAYQLQHVERAGAPELQGPSDYLLFLFGRSGLLALAAWTLLAFLLLRGWDDLRRRREGGTIPPGLLLGAWALGPFVVASVVSWSSTNVLTAENLLVSLSAVCLLLARSVTRTFSGRAAGIFQGTVAVGLGAACLAYLVFSMDYHTTPTRDQVREAAAYVAAHGDDGTLLVRCDADRRLDYYLGGKRNDVEACDAKDLRKIQSRVKKGDYQEIFHFVSYDEPDQRRISMLQRNFQPVHYERFDGAAVVVYKVRKDVPANLEQPEPPAKLPRHE